MVSRLIFRDLLEPILELTFDNGVGGYFISALEGVDDIHMEGEFQRLLALLFHLCDEVVLGFLAVAVHDLEIIENKGVPKSVLLPKVYLNGSVQFRADVLEVEERQRRNGEQIFFQVVDFEVSSRYDAGSFVDCDCAHNCV